MYRQVLVIALAMLAYQGKDDKGGDEIDCCSNKTGQYDSLTSWSEEWFEYSCDERTNI